MKTIVRIYNFILPAISATLWVFIGMMLGMAVIMVEFDIDAYLVKPLRGLTYSIIVCFFVINLIVDTVFDLVNRYRRPAPSQPAKSDA